MSSRSRKLCVQLACTLLIPCILLLAVTCEPGQEPADAESSPPARAAAPPALSPALSQTGAAPRPAGSTPSLTSSDVENSEETPYRHPLLRAGETGHRLFAEARDAAARYVVEEGRFVDQSGAERSVSGVRPIERRVLSDAERAARRREKERLHGPRAGEQDRRGDATAEAKLGPHLAAMQALARAGRLQAAAPGAAAHDDDDAGLVEVVVSVRRQPRMTVADEVERALLRGDIDTRADHQRVLAAALERRQADVEQAQAPVLEDIERAGGRVLTRARNTHLAVALVPLSAVQTLAARTDVARVELHTAEDDEVHGHDIIKAHQLDQLIAAGYDGENSGKAFDLTFAQVEGGGADNEHPGFRETWSTTTRIRGLFSCGDAGCSPTSNFSTGSESGHASAVAGIIFGDLRDGQDSSLRSTADRTSRSGYAGEARGWLFKGSGTLAFEHIAGMTGATAPRVVNMSAGKADADPSCTGRDSRSRAANELFESGKLLIKSAGNQGHGSSSDCTVTSPGNALGVFSVASLGASADGDVTTVREATISGFSSRGGTRAEGGGRTIVDLAAYGYRRDLFDDEGGYSRSGGGTSYAAPTVTAAALDFVDHYKHEYSDLIDDPGILVANLLLMGDRSTEDGERADHGFDNLYGAGRLRARRFDEEGMDTPWGYSTGHVCIDHGATYTLALNDGAPLSSDVDVLNAVLWWYDSRHERNGTLDDIDLRLKSSAGATLQSSLSLDNKERVFSTSVGGQRVELELHGYRVTADDTGCGVNAMKVYYAYFYEDTDRDDVDGPGRDIE